MEITDRLRTSLLPVFGLDSISEIKPEDSLVKNLGADSLDFVEIVFIIEKEFKVVLETKEIVAGGAEKKADEIFDGGSLTDSGAEVIRKSFSFEPGRFTAGMSKIEIFQMITVRDLASIIKNKLEMK